MIDEEYKAACDKCGWIFRRLRFYTPESGYKKVMVYEADEMRDKHQKDCEETPCERRVASF
jgi:hypothetical protein